MKFGEAFMEYLHNERERYSVLEKCWHVEYKRFKKVLKTCQTCKDEDEAAAVASSRQKNQNQISCQCQSCPGKYFIFTFLSPFFHFVFFEYSLLCFLFREWLKFVESV